MRPRVFVGGWSALRRLRNLAIAMVVILVVSGLFFGFQDYLLSTAFADSIFRVQSEKVELYGGRLKGIRYVLGIRFGTTTCTPRYLGYRDYAPRDHTAEWVEYHDDSLQILLGLSQLTNSSYPTFGLDNDRVKPLDDTARRELVAMTLPLISKGQTDTAGCYLAEVYQTMLKSKNTVSSADLPDLKALVASGKVNGNWRSYWPEK